MSPMAKGGRACFAAGQSDSESPPVKPLPRPVMPMRRSGRGSRNERAKWARVRRGPRALVPTVSTVHALPTHFALYRSRKYREVILYLFGWPSARPPAAAPPAHFSKKKKKKRPRGEGVPRSWLGQTLDDPRIVGGSSRAISTSSPSSLVSPERKLLRQSSDS